MANMHRDENLGVELTGNPAHRAQDCDDVSLGHTIFSDLAQAARLTVLQRVQQLQHPILEILLTVRFGQARTVPMAFFNCPLAIAAA